MIEEAAHPSAPDQEKARTLARIAFSDSAVGAYVAWLRAETERIATSARFLLLLGALVPVLLEHGRMSGAAARGILKAADDY